MGLAAALAVSVVAGAQQTQATQAAKAKPGTKSKAASGAPFDPCTGDGLPPSSQMAPFAPGSPSNINPPVPKTVKGTVKCSDGKCKAVENSPYTEQGAAENGFPEAKSAAAAKQADGLDAPEASGAAENPFPEAKSAAAQAAAEKSADQAPSQQGQYSSSDQRLPGVNALGDGPVVNGGAEAHPALDPELGKKDDKVGQFYLRSEDWAGAYGRYKEATEVNPGDIQAVIGLAIAADHLGKRDEAIRDYKLYLTVMPDGGQSKAALKALKRLSGEK